MNCASTRCWQHARLERHKSQQSSVPGRDPAEVLMPEITRDNIRMSYVWFCCSNVLVRVVTIQATCRHVFSESWDSLPHP